MHIWVIVKKILPVALGNRNGPWATIYILLSWPFWFEFSFQTLNISNPSITLGEPHKTKHTLSTLSFKHDSMCHKKICTGQKIITENPEFTWQGIPNFQSVPSDHCGLFRTVSPISIKNSDILNFYSSLTINNENE